MPLSCTESGARIPRPEITWLRVMKYLTLSRTSGSPGIGGLAGRTATNVVNPVASIPNGGWLIEVDWLIPTHSWLIGDGLFWCQLAFALYRTRSRSPGPVNHLTLFLASCLSQSISTLRFLPFVRVFERCFIATASFKS